jgi:gamma-glutamyltranspeptidase/glutathione hydrolase
MLKKYFPILLIILSACTSTPRVRGPIGEKMMVVTAHPDATQIGLDVLKRGGNAYDAAIATQFALAVAYPIAGNVGGGGFLVYRKFNGETGALDFREKAPAAAHRDMFLDSAGNIVSGLSTSSHRASGVPGSVDGMWEMHKRLGSLPFKDLVQPAIDLAEGGVILTEREASNLNAYAESFKSNNLFKSHFLKESGWKTGDTLFHRDLANVLKRIAERGRDGFYSGETADLIVAEMKRGGGIITHEDLNNYHSVWREPVKGLYKNYTIISMPPPSSGGIALVQLLKMVEPYNIRGYGFNSASAVHLMAEAERRVYADRATHLGDPDFYGVPQNSLLDKDYLKARMRSFQPSAATPSEKIKAGVFKKKENEETTHFSIVDRWGNAASITTTINDNYGSKVMVEGAGFLLNNEMDDFSAKPGAPNIFGLVGGVANQVEPQKRMLSSMTPTIVEKWGKLYMVVGTPGGATIITSVFQTILNVIEHDMTMQEAVAAKRFHHQWLPDQITIEEGALEADVLKELEEKGHKIATRSRIGSVEGILVLPDGKLEGGADPRGDSKAMGE